MVVWKVSPPCPAEVKLEKMFKAGSIAPDATQKSVKVQEKIFEPFSPAVFGKHFRRLKNKYSKRNGGDRKFM